MRVSLGVPYGRRVLLYHPELFNDYEEVIIFPREEFRIIYDSIREWIDDICKSDGYLKTGKDFLLLGYWPDIMESIKLIEININLILDEEPLQTYLDAYLYGTITKDVDIPTEFESSVLGKLRSYIDI